MLLLIWEKVRLDKVVAILATLRGPPCYLFYSYFCVDGGCISLILGSPHDALILNKGYVEGKEICWLDKVEYLN